MRATDRSAALSALPALALPAWILIGSHAFAAPQAPDVVASVVAFQWRSYGSLDGIRAFSFGTTLCNQGDLPLAVDPFFDTPVVGKNLFRIADGQIRQIGYGFPTARVCALSEPSCGACQPTACDTLGVGCADTSLLFDGGIGWGKWGIDANRGEWPEIPAGPSGDPRDLNGRIQVAALDLSHPDAIYVAESQVVSAHDQQSGSGGNNQSWREVDLLAAPLPANLGMTHIGEPGIFAWREVHPDVRLSEARLEDEGGPGLPGTFWLGSRATPLPGGQWRYDYALQNTTSRVAAGGLRIPTPCGSGTVTQDSFHGVRHHSGSPFADTPWTFSPSRTALRWSTTGFAADPNGNAVRWGNLFTFRFVSDAPPRRVRAQVQLFEQPGVVEATVLAPAACEGPGSLDPGRSGPPR